MKKVLSLLALLLFAMHLFAQSEIKIVAFTADAPFQSIVVRNNTTLESVTLNYPDTLLTLNVPQGEAETSVDAVLTQTFLQQKTKSSVIVSVQKSGMQKLQLIDLTGKIVCRTEKELSVGEYEFEICAPNAGIYVLTVENAEQKASIKMSLEKSQLAQIEYVNSSVTVENQLKSLADMLSYTRNTEYTIMCVSAKGNYIINKKTKIRLTGEKTVVNLNFLPTMLTPVVSNITKYTATIQCEVLEDVDIATEIERGFCVNGKYFVVDGQKNGSMILDRSNLQVENQYLVKPYVKNNEYVKYGPEIEFFTLNADCPTVTTSSASNVMETSATLGGNVTSDGGATVTERGVCWSTSTNPTISNSKKAIGSGTGSFSASITGLAANTTYYVRAYATNSKGTSYGEQIMVKTSAVAPTVTTSSASNVMETSATLGGNVTSDGGATVTERGVCWSTSTNPTISNSKKAIGSGTGSFSSAITGLTEGTTYHVRAYATNSKGTSYGEQITVKTPQQVKIVNGAIQAAFSVSRTKKVYFSMGNLQYQASTNTWRFAENQYDIICDTNSNISSTYSDYIDWFGWGTSGYNGKNPYMTSPRESDYGVVGFYYADIAGTNYDWGVYNAIQNGGNSAGMWRTLTEDEWDYVLDIRTDASALKGLATVSGVTGMVLLPDNWTTPEGITFTSGKNNGFSNNTYTTSDWVKMEANGAVFLPAAGYRRNSGVDYRVGYCGRYWSSSASSGAVCLDFVSSSIIVNGCYRSYGQSVRLVREVNSNTDSGDTGNQETGGLENGAIKAAFSVSDSKQVNFSMGNLQYKASTNTWRFAENQYDIIGDNNSNISSTYSGWIDLFGWGTSGYNGKNPYMTSDDWDDYGVVGDIYADIAGTDYDWGVYNKISNGGNSVGQWRTLTSREWYYVLNTRTDASALKGSATVNGVTGMVLLPDNWTTPSDITFRSGMNGYNTYTTSDWVKMEANGAVFLPAAGSRDGSDVYRVGYHGCYWSSSAGGLYVNYVNKMLFYSDLTSHSGDACMYLDSRYSGQSVRLVRDLIK